MPKVIVKVWHLQGFASGGAAQRMKEQIRLVLGHYPSSRQRRLDDEADYNIGFVELGEASQSTEQIVVEVEFLGIGISQATVDLNTRALDMAERLSPCLPNMAPQLEHPLDISLGVLLRSDGMTGWGVDTRKA